MTDYKRKTSDALAGRTIEKAELSGHYVTIRCTDGTILDYSASDGGYSCWDVTLPDGRKVE